LWAISERIRPRGSRANGPQKLDLEPAHRLEARGLVVRAKKGWKTAPPLLGASGAAVRRRYAPSASAARSYSAAATQRIIP